MISFYASTPAYRVVLDIHGWGETQEVLRALTREGRWADMAGQITDEMVDTIALVGTPEEIASRLEAEYSHVADRVAVYTPAGAPDLSAEIIEAFRRH